MIDIATDLDLFGDQDIKIIRRTKDLTDIASKEGEFTYSFEGPASPKNQKALMNYGIIDAKSNFDPHKGIAASWSFGSFSKFVGRLEVSTVVYKNGEPFSFSFNFYGRQRSLATVFGSDRLSDIDWSEYNHDLTYENVLKSWVGLLSGGDLMYPLIDSRENYYFGDPSQNLKGNIRNANHPILLTDLRPAISFKAFMLSIFKAYGLTVIGSLIDALDGYTKNLYVLINRYSGSGVSADTYEQNFCSYKNASTDLLTTYNTETIVSIPTMVQDDNGLWDGSKYTALIDGVHNFTGFFLMNFYGSDNFGKYNFIVKKNGINVQEYTLLPDLDDTQTQLNIPSLSIQLTAGDEIEFYYRRAIRYLGPIEFYGRDTKVTGGKFSVSGPLNQLGQTVSLSDQMTDDKIVDWIGQFIKSMNWVLIPNELNDTEWELMSVEEYYSRGAVRDWTEYIDLANITYNKMKVYKEISMRYEKSDAAIHVAYRDATGKGYGDLLATPDVEFGEAKFEVVNPCSLIPPALFKILDTNGEETGEFADATIHKSINVEGSPVKEKAILFYYNGLRGTAFSYYIQNGFAPGGNPVGTVHTIYPHIGSVQDFPSLPESNTLTYSLESPLIGNVALKTVYANYWESQLMTQYAKESRQIESARLVIPISEFNYYSLGDEIFIERNYWRIIEISHDKNGREATVTLISSRRLNPINGKTVSEGGQIVFESEPSTFEKSAAGAYKKDGNFYGSFLRAQTKPNLNTYTNVVTQINQTIINEINEINGRLRSWGES